MKFFVVIFPLALLSLQGCAVKTDDSGQNSNRTETRIPPPAPTTNNDEIKPKPVKTDPQSTAETPLRFETVEIEDAAAVVRDYYAAVNSRDYRKAYEFWSGKGEASGQTFEEFKNGFAETVSVEIDIGGEPGEMGAAAGSRHIEIPLTIEAETIRGETRKFAGVYVLRRSVVDGATDEQRAWRIHSADIRRRN